jgi:uncharacterized iron-regulated protein
MKSSGLWIAVLSVALAACQTVVNPHGQIAVSSGHGGFDEVPEYKPGDEYAAPRMLDLSTVRNLDTIMPKLLEKRVIYVGETHDRLDHHLNQLEIIRRAYEDSPKLAIGMEFFQQPFQPALDDYIAGRSDEKEFLRKSEYFQRWRIDYRNYRPILQFAREKKIPVLALDITEEVRKKVVRNQMDQLSEAEKAQLPDEIDRSSAGYREMLQSIFDIHPESAQFDRFLEAQLTRDEAMAQTAAAWLKKNPDSRMVVLAGGGHIVYGYGIPGRVARRVGAPGAIVLNDSLREYEPGVADYLLLPSPLRLPKEARLGVILDTSQAGQLSVTSFAQGSPAKQAGLEAGDRILSVDNQMVAEMADLKIALLDKNPGDKVPVRVQRRGWFGSEKELGFEVVLY